MPIAEFSATQKIAFRPLQSLDGHLFNLRPGPGFAAGRGMQLKSATGYAIWPAENLTTFYGIWKYPNPLGAWSSVQMGKWSSWSVLDIMSLSIPT
jgi:hypothetical protein